MEQDRKSLAKKHQLLLPTSQAMAQVTRKPHKVVAPSERGRRREASLSLLGEGFSGPARRHELTKLAAARQGARPMPPNILSDNNGKGGQRGGDSVSTLKPESKTARPARRQARTHKHGLQARLPPLRSHLAKTASKNERTQA